MPQESAHLSWIPLLGIVLLAITCGYLLGRLTTIRFSLPDIPITITEDTRPILQVLRIDGIRNGMIEGRILGDARVFFGDELVLPTASGTFAFPPDVFLKNIVDIVIPSDMQFVASKRGKKYYPVGSSAGEQLVPENRIYFKTEEDAKGAGYVK